MLCSFKHTKKPNLLCNIKSMNRNNKRSLEDRFGHSSKKWNAYSRKLISWKVVKEPLNPSRRMPKRLKKLMLVCRNVLETSTRESSLVESKWPLPVKRVSSLMKLHLPLNNMVMNITMNKIQMPVHLCTVMVLRLTHLSVSSHVAPWILESLNSKMFLNKTILLILLKITVSHLFNKSGIQV